MQITCVPSLPDESYAEKDVTFSEPALIQDILDHLRVRLWLGGQQSTQQAYLSYLGSGVVGIAETQGENISWELRGNGGNFSYTLVDVSAGHGLFVYSLEWV